MATPDGSPDTPREPRQDYAPEGSAHGTSRFQTLKRTFTEFSEDSLSDSAAALTYYGLLAVFPALIALVAIVGLVGNPASTVKTLTQIVTKLGQASSAQTFAGPIKSITMHKSASGILLVVGIVGALYSASSYVGAFMRACNVIYETPEGRPFWKLRPLQMLVTLLMLLLLVAIALALVLTGPIVDAVAGPLGVGSAAISVWNIAKWPVMALLMVVMVTVLFYASPNVKLRGFRWVMPGAAFALAVWLLASIAFAFYVANFGSYDKTYGTLGGVVAFLVWLWITNSALLLGAELNAERERTHELKAGVPGAEREIQLDARSEPKTPKTT
ncbi:MAG: YihY/virulence factor BrkB family protein [Solirubrobacteraceae bacterium]